MMPDGKKKSKESPPQEAGFFSDSFGFDSLFGSIAPKSISSPQGAPSMFATIAAGLVEVKRKYVTAGALCDIGEYCYYSR